MSINRKMYTMEYYSTNNLSLHFKKHSFKPKKSHKRTYSLISFIRSSKNRQNNLKTEISTVVAVEQGWEIQVIDYKEA